MLFLVRICGCFRVEFAALEYSQPLSMRRLDYLVGSVRRSFGDSINQLIDYLGVKVVYSDLRDTMMDGLYLPTVQDCRIDDALPALTARLRSLDALLTEAVVREVHDGAALDCPVCSLLSQLAYTAFTSMSKRCIGTSLGVFNGYSSMVAFIGSLQ